MKRVLFILKKRRLYSERTPELTSSGLINSAGFISTMLNSLPGVVSKVVEVIDNNCIDREVTRFKPTHVIIEALWVVPDKFHVLSELHPEVEWIVRLHSNTPFLAGEGVAFEWIAKYLKQGKVKISVNHEKMYDDLAALFPNAAYTNKILLQPNYYPVSRSGVNLWSDKVAHFKSLKETEPLRIGCFGAIRPMKNQVQQAIAAIQFADEEGMELFFHINSARVEKGENCLRNLRAIFKASPHTLVEHGWMGHGKFKSIIKHMDLSMQVSFSETFNVVTADAVSLGVPVVVSKEIDWIPSAFTADPTDTLDIQRAINKALHCQLGPWRNYRSLYRYSQYSKQMWENYFLPR